MAVVGVVFIRSLYGAEDLFEHRLRNPYLRHVVGMAGVGVTMVALMELSGHYYVQGVGYATIIDVLTRVAGRHRVPAPPVRPQAVRRPR